MFHLQSQYFFSLTLCITKGLSSQIILIVLYITQNLFYFSTLPQSHLNSKHQGHLATLRLHFLSTFPEFQGFLVLNLADYWDKTLLMSMACISWICSR